MSNGNTFEYFCMNCGAPATKTPLKNQKDWQILEPSDFGHLGAWHCTGGCKGKVKVKRKAVKQPIAVAA